MRMGHSVCVPPLFDLPCIAPSTNFHPCFLLSFRVSLSLSLSVCLSLPFSLYVYISRSQSPSVSILLLPSYRCYVHCIVGQFQVVRAQEEAVAGRVQDTGAAVHPGRDCRPPGHHVRRRLVYPQEGNTLILNGTLASQFQLQY